ncbi:T9SS type A sorting domain-containing protein [Vaginella massiliensis]|uniref:T9SS type A sorting domain-containing protein n=1 Tax=Vaginella massiliensis TaxID=1816680 RepID=UPI000839304F|nr:T9SS type A sorting domain-containing protein [Vaginella massiliensis]
MKNIFTLLLSFATFGAFAQEIISFEASEGYTLGTIHNQNGWEVTESADGLITNQIITNEQAKDGIYSFKNGHQDEYEPQWLPIFGVHKAFAQPMDYKTFSISYDIFVTEKLGSDFEFTTYGINPESEEFSPIIGLGVENRGLLYYIKNENYQAQYIDGINWQTNTWNTIKIEIKGEQVSYYFNNELVATSTIFSQLPIVGINFLHNNYGGSAYYDNIIINEEELATNDLNATAIALYPNPVDAHFTVELPKGEDLKSVEILNSTGQKILSSTSKTTAVESLANGVYLVNITTSNGKIYTKKIIKK